MTDDLVEKLREQQSWGSVVAGEAADRIEVLEARLKKAEDRLKQYKEGMVTIRRWIETGEIPR